MSDNITIFFDTEGNRLGSDLEVIPITLYKGMEMTIHGYPGVTFKVVDWNYHHGHGAEDAGLRIILRRS
jgi:hypothetical protein